MISSGDGWNSEHTNDNIDEEGEDSDGQEFINSLTSPRRKKSASRLRVSSRRKKTNQCIDGDGRPKLQYERSGLSTSLDSSFSLPPYGYATVRDHQVNVDESWLGGDYEVEDLQEERLGQRYS